MKLPLVVLLLLAHSVSAGRLFALGRNTHEQLGLGSATDLSPYIVPAEILSEDVSEVACGPTYSLIRRNADIYSAGTNMDGVLGTGGAFDNDTSAGFTKLDTPTLDIGGGIINQGYARSIHASGATAYAETQIGWYGWGYNGPYTLTGTQDGTTTPATTPQRIPFMTDPLEWTKIVSAGDHAFALAENGTLYSWGDNTAGVLGRGTPGVADPTPGIVLEDVVDICTGVNHSIAIKANGTALSFGSAARGKLGQGVNATDTVVPTPITISPFELFPIYAGCAVSDHHSLVVTDDGAVRSFGAGDNWVLGVASLDDAWDPVLVEPLYNPTGKAEFVREVYASNTASYGRTVEGVLYVWGSSNDDGKLGSEWNQPRPAFVPFFRLNNGTRWRITSLCAGPDFTLAVGEIDLVRPETVVSSFSSITIEFVIISILASSLFVCILFFFLTGSFSGVNRPQVVDMPNLRARSAAPGSAKLLDEAHPPGTIEDVAENEDSDSSDWDKPSTKPRITRRKNRDQGSTSDSQGEPLVVIG